MPAIQGKFKSKKEVKMNKIIEPRPAQFPSQKPMELPGKNTVYEPEQPGTEIPGQPLRQPEPGPDIPPVQDPPSRPLVM